MAELLLFSDPGAYAVMALMIFTAAFMQGVGGVGFAMFAAPAAAIWYPQLVPGPLLALGGFVALLTTLRERRHVIWPAVGTALVGRGAGTLVAVYAMGQLAARSLNLLFAILILSAVVLSVAGLHIAASRRNVGMAGVFSGVMGTLTSVGSPPLAIAFQHTPPENLRATLGLILFIGASFSLAMLWLTGHYSLHQLFLSIALAPFMFLGFALSSRARSKISPTAVRRMLLSFCACAAIGLLWRTL